MAAKLSLLDVTLLTATSVDIDRTHAALLHCMQCADFGAVKMLYPALPAVPDQRIQYIRIPHIDFLGYSRLMIEGLNACVQTSHCLVVQADGFILNPARWQNEFFEYDYIGAPRPKSVVFTAPQNRRTQLKLNKNSVGNGGFSLRSKKLLEVIRRSRRCKRRKHARGCQVLPCNALRALGVQL